MVTNMKTRFDRKLKATMTLFETNFVRCAFLVLIVLAGLPTSVRALEEPTTTAQAEQRDPNTSLHERYPRYKLRKGDSFDLDMEFSSEFNQTVVVQPDGYITLKGVGSVHVEGETIPELTETIRSAYSKTLHDPVIAISLKDFEKPYFVATGQVEKPGKYDLRSDLTVTEAVAIAGGFTDKAKHSQVVLFRPSPSGGYEAKLINIKKLLNSRNLSEDLEVQPGDLVYVPQNAISKIRPFLPSSSMGAFLGPGVF
jgi:polysaccharide export outer membrane protein